MSWMTEYPRPQLKRESFFCLNGEWVLDEQKIQVPFPPQSKLSGFAGEVKDMLTYVKLFRLPEGFLPRGWRLMLHFGAVDQIADVFFNGRPVAHHEGGYLPFSADVTELIKQGENEIVVAVLDALDHDYPYGKQCKKRGGMWYTPVSGIWQTVWMEAVPEKRVESIRITPDLAGITLQVEAGCGEVQVCIPGVGEQTVPSGQPVRIDVPQPRLWTVEDPHLYALHITAGEDRVESYFALRTVEVRGNRILLNGEPVFLNGVLDQGYFQEGIFLPESPEGYADDVRRMKALGFNMLRKHIKVELEAFYYACDRLGMLVLQDMVNSGPYNFLLDTALPTIGITKRPLLPAGEKRKQVFMQHALDTQRHLYNHPCIVGYTIFNEGWGQHDTEALYRLLKENDPTRFYDAASGWFIPKETDVDSVHVYFRNKKLKPGQRPMLLSECGGYARPIAGHLFQPDAKYGYGKTDTEQALTDKIIQMYEEMVLPAIPQGLCGVVYTQLSDVEDEINGLYTYDRQVCKVDAEKLAAYMKKVRI